MQGESLFVALGGYLISSALVGKIVWDWLKEGKNKRVPLAKDGFLDFEDLQAHCKKEQDGCKRIITGSLELTIIKLEHRLESGDKLFKDIQITIKTHSRLLSSLMKQLNEEKTKKDKKEDSMTKIRQHY